MSESLIADRSSAVERRVRHALWLSYFTVAYNIAEGLTSVVFGGLAGSTALVGFGVDSFVESLSGAIMIWRFYGHRDCGPQDHLRREARAVRLVGVALLLLGLYVVYESAVKLYRGEPPERTVVGLVIAVVSLAVMPPLYFAKRRLGRELGSVSLVADANQTLACMLLSVALIMGVGLHFAFNVWQADPIAGLVIAGFLARESWRAIQKHELCCS
jgi:divalent metal cation (Fe/Co/Zn/Cd) transporter